jgi:hypothetical protein
LQRFLLPRLAWNHDPPDCRLPCILGYRGGHCTQLLFDMGPHQLKPRLVTNHDLPDLSISSSQDCGLDSLARSFVFSLLLLFSLFFPVLRFELRASHSVGKCPNTWAVSPALQPLLLYCFVVSQAGLRPWFFHPYALHIARIKFVNYHTRLVIWQGVSIFFHLGWPQTLIPPASTSKITGIIGMNHHTQPIVNKFLILHLSSLPANWNTNHKPKKPHHFP